jgi:MFS family permease
VRRSILPLLAVMAAGLAYYGARGSLANFVISWQDAFDVSRGDVSLIVTASFLSMGLAQIVGGKLLERVSPWKVLAAGMVLGIAGYGLGAVAPNLGVAVFLVGIIAGFGAGLAANSTLMVIVAQLYTERQGTLFGVVGAATAAGAIVMLPTSRLALEISLEAALVLLAALIAVALVGVLWFLRPNVSAPVTRANPPPIRQVIRVGDFWLLSIPFFVCGVTSTGVTDTHLVAYMEGCHIGGGTASSLAASLALFNLVGTFASGVITDRVNPRLLLAVIYSTRGLVLLVLPLLQTTELLAVFAVLFGLADFSSVPPTTALARNSFRHGGWALVLGLIGAMHQAGSALGGIGGGELYDLTGGYGAFFVSAAAVCFVAAGLSLLVSAGPDAHQRGQTLLLQPTSP